MNADDCPICGGKLTTYKSTRHGDLTRRLRHCKNRRKRKCTYKESIVLRITETILARKPMAG